MMKVLIDHGTPFVLAHGGFQIQIQQTRAALRKIGVDADWLNWWDDSVRPDVIHWFGGLHSGYIRYAQRKGIRIVLSELRTGMGSRKPWQLALHRRAIQAAQRFAPGSILATLRWDVYPLVDAATALTPWEAHLMTHVLGCPPNRLRVIPNGVEDEFFDVPPAAQRTQWLICTATIHPRKRVLELARAAVLAKTPVWIIGKPYSEDEAYYREFIEAVRKHPEIIRYEGEIADRAQLAKVYSEARGFVLVSTMESLSLSALEAAATRCPLLFSDLPWARTTFGESASYCPDTSNPEVIASALRKFYNADHSGRPGFKPLRWVDIAEQLKALYTEVLSR